MLPFKLIYSDNYYLPIGAHVFPAENMPSSTTACWKRLSPGPKTSSLLNQLLIRTSCWSTAPEYVHKLKTGTLSPQKRCNSKFLFPPNSSGILAGGRRIDSVRAPGLDRSHRH